MPTAFHAGAVLYAKDVSRVQGFYHAVLGLSVEHEERDHVILASPAFQLVLLALKEPIASSVEIESPPRRRTEVPVKLAFEIPSISAARALAPAHGGELLPPEREWNFQGYRVCDGRDPEGNVVQLRQTGQ